MRRAALVTALFFLAQATVCAHAGFGAAATFDAHPAMAAGAGTCAGMDARAPRSDAGETPAERCSRHCAEYAQSVPALAPMPQLAGPLRLPVERIAFAPATWAAGALQVPERAPPWPPLRLLLASLQI